MLPIRTCSGQFSVGRHAATPPSVWKGDSMRSSSPVRVIIAIVVLGLVLAACRVAQQSGSPSGSGIPAPSSNLTGGTVRIGIGGSPDSLNPGNGLLAEAYTLYELV